MKVYELIAHLQSLPPDVQQLEVVYGLHSEQVLMELDEISVERFCLPRPDGWVQNYRKDMPSQLYLSFPGN